MWEIHKHTLFSCEKYRMFQHVLIDQDECIKSPMNKFRLRISFRTAAIMEYFMESFSAIIRSRALVSILFFFG